MDKETVKALLLDILNFAGEEVGKLPWSLPGVHTAIDMLKYVLTQTHVLDSIFDHLQSKYTIKAKG